MPSPPTLRALLLDFDGLVLDTESSHYRAWCEPFAARGVELRLERWQQVVGTHDSPWSPVAELEELSGEPVDADRVREQVADRFHELLLEQACMAGVLELVDEARGAGLPVAVASSSQHTWPATHLERLGVADRFDVVVGRDLVGWRSKPDPAVYVEALRRLGVEPDHALALEDSANGVLAAARAGIPVVAVPNAVTASMAFDGAVAVLDSLAGITLAHLCELSGHRLGVSP